MIAPADSKYRDKGCQNLTDAGLCTNRVEPMPIAHQCNCDTADNCHEFSHRNDGGHRPHQQALRIRLQVVLVDIVKHMNIRMSNV